MPPAPLGAGHTVGGLFDSFISHDLAVDLGTATTLIYARGRGIVSHEPSVVAVQTDRRGERRVLAVGKDAKEMLGRTPEGIEAIRPLREGVIADYEVAAAMLKYFITKVTPRRPLLRPRVVICVPHGINDVEKRAVRESAEASGAREVYLVAEPMAAAIGAGLPVTEPAGNMIVDIGGGTTEIAVISLAGIVYSRSLKVGGDRLDAAIVQHLRRKYGLLIGERTAEQIKLAIGAATRVRELDQCEARGRDLNHGVPRSVSVHSEEIREALEEPLAEIIGAVRGALEETPPELSADIVDKGIVIAGGGALLRGIDALLRDQTGLPVLVADDPIGAVVLGAGALLDNATLLREVALK